VLNRNATLTKRAPSGGGAGVRAQTNRDARGPATLLGKVLLLVSAKKLTLVGLAAEMGVSRATAARALRELRRRGERIACTRDGHGWYYEVKGRSADRPLWQADPLAQLCGFASSKECKAQKLRWPKPDRTLYQRDAHRQQGGGRHAALDQM